MQTKLLINGELVAGQGQAHTVIAPPQERRSPLSQRQAKSKSAQLSPPRMRRFKPIPKQPLQSAPKFC